MEQNAFEDILYPSPEKPKKTRRWWIFLLLVPALLLTAAKLWKMYDANRPLVTAPGNLEIYAYSLPTEFVAYENCIKLEPGVNLPEEYGFLGGNFHMRLPLTFSLTDEAFADAGILFEFFLSGGEFYRGEGKSGARPGRAYLGQWFRLENNQTINWDRGTDQDMRQATADIVVYADGHIIGCATLWIGFADPVDYPDHSDTFEYEWFPKLLGSVSFPKQNGRYQNVSEEDLQPYFDQWKQK